MKSDHILGEAIALLGLPAWVINDALVATFANSLTYRYRDQVHVRKNSRIRISDIVADAAIKSALDKIGDDRFVRSFPVNDSEGKATHIMHLFPIQQGARTLFPDSTAVMVITSLAPSSARPELLQITYGLTPAEAEVARRLAMGSSVEHISASNGTSPNTVRSHLRKVLEKTGCSRQAEAVALLSAFSSLITSATLTARAAYDE